MDYRSYFLIDKNCFHRKSGIIFFSVDFKFMRESSMLELQSRTSNTILVINSCHWEQIPVLIPSFKVLLQVYAAFPQNWGMQGVVRLIQVRNIEARKYAFSFGTERGRHASSYFKSDLRLIRLKFLWVFFCLCSKSNSKLSGPGSETYLTQISLVIRRLALRISSLAA